MLRHVEELSFLAVDPRPLVLQIVERKPLPHPALDACAGCEIDAGAMRLVGGGVFVAAGDGGAFVVEVKDADETVFRVEDLQGLRDALRFGILPLHEDHLTAAIAADQRHLDPNERGLRLRVPVLDRVRERRVVFVAGEAEVRTVRLGGGEIEIRRGQRDRQREVPHIASYVSTGCRGVELQDAVTTPFRIVRGAQHPVETKQ